MTNCTVDEMLSRFYKGERREGEVRVFLLRQLMTKYSCQAFRILKTIDFGVFYTNYRELSVNYQTTKTTQ